MFRSTGIQLADHLVVKIWTKAFRLAASFSLSGLLAGLLNDLYFVTVDAYGGGALAASSRQGRFFLER